MDNLRNNEYVNRIERARMMINSEIRSDQSRGLDLLIFLLTASPDSHFYLEIIATKPLMQHQLLKQLQILPYVTSQNSTVYIHDIIQALCANEVISGFLGNNKILQVFQKQLFSKRLPNHLINCILMSICGIVENSIDAKFANMCIQLKILDFNINEYNDIDCAGRLNYIYWSRQHCIIRILMNTDFNTVEYNKIVVPMVCKNVTLCFRIYGSDDAFDFVLASIQYLCENIKIGSQFVSYFTAEFLDIILRLRSLNVPILVSEIDLFISNLDPLKHMPYK
jgi:hypothetical protein